MPLLEFGRVNSREAEAIGEPGQRTFRLRVSSGQRTASLWLEKEQLQALALALMRLPGQMGQAEIIPAAGERAEAVLACRVAPAHGRDLVAMIEGIVAAGRPICRLCLGPIDPEGHVCARSNGHRSEDELEELR